MTDPLLPAGESVNPFVSCDGCGACCLMQCSPPMYVYWLDMPESDDNRDDEDWCRVNSLPEPLKEELREYRRKIRESSGDGPNFDDFACIWLDESTMKCKHYEHRPSICRDFQVGSEECLGWREEFEV